MSSKAAYLMWSSSRNIKTHVLLHAARQGFLLSVELGKCVHIVSPLGYSEGLSHSVCAHACVRVCVCRSIVCVCTFDLFVCAGLVCVYRF